MTFECVILNEARLRPLMQAQDAVKLAFTSEFGSGHIISHFDYAADVLREEYDNSAFLAPTLYEEISDNLCRINIANAKSAGLSSSTVLRMFALAGKSGNEAGFYEKIDIIKSLISQNLLPFTLSKLNEYLSNFDINNGQPSHSAEYKAAYHPSYRLVPKAFCEFLPIFIKIDALLSQNVSPLIGIDGPCACGKTTTADLLAKIYPCNIVHADSFFLPIALRTPQRLAQAGGNIDYERLSAQIITRLPTADIIDYDIFSCKIMDFSGKGTIFPALPTIIEGSYSLHPFFGDAYDLRVFISASEDVRFKRLKLRESAESLELFKTRWMPYENLYFEKYDIEKSCELVLQTK